MKLVLSRKLTFWKPQKWRFGRWFLWIFHDFPMFKGVIRSGSNVIFVSVDVWAQTWKRKCQLWWQQRGSKKGVCFFVWLITCSSQSILWGIPSANTTGTLRIHTHSECPFQSKIGFSGSPLPSESRLGFDGSGEHPDFWSDESLHSWPNVGPETSYI